MNLNSASSHSGWTVRIFEKKRPLPKDNRPPSIEKPAEEGRSLSSAGNMTEKAKGCSPIP